MEEKNKKIIVGLSGGIDSSMTAYLLKNEGYEVEGIYMKLHESVIGYHEKNIEAIEKVTSFLNIKYHVIDFTQKFKDEVYDYFVQSYIDGITPNPCVKCNSKIKFGMLYEEAMNLGADLLATGHYAKTDGKFLYKADDLSKDQSYFLGQISKEVIPKLMFPMSKYTKEFIRGEAMKIPALVDIAQKKDSQEICFVDTVYTDILKQYTDIDKEGKTLDKDGNVIGHHKGYMHYTVGKRKGFYVHGAHEPHFVLKQDKSNNTITVGKKEDLAINNVTVDKLNMFIDDIDFICDVKLRFRSATVKCQVNINDDNATLQLKSPVYGVAVGQTAVFYHDDKVIGSGWITTTKNI
ncbi:MAG: tRNA 2-thiouridine(34) synthase MnmA [Campylobacterota bacterium]|nr:tRNA 2-thiouridine(34) synthase MnmA [Campylobacterota bacterium]